MSKRRLQCEVLEQRYMLSATSNSTEDSTATCTSTWEFDEASVPAAASSTTSAIDFFRLEPLGSQVSASQGNVGSITEPATDEIDFTFFVETGETIAAIATPDDAGTVLTVEYVEGSGASASAGGPGEAAVLGPIGVAADGMATIRVTGSGVTTFTLEIYRNTALEAEGGESGPGNKVDLAPSLVDVGGKRYAGIGTTSLAPIQTILYSEDFEASPGYTNSGLWHISDGRATDGQVNHAGNALYFGQAEIAGDFIGTLNWDAELDATDNNIWESTVNNNPTIPFSTQWAFNSASAPGTSGSASNLAGVKEWYTFGATATMDSIHDSQGNSATLEDATWELVFRPRDFTGTHILFETGGNGDGLVFLLNENTLEFRVQDDDDDTRRVVRTFTFDLVNDVDEFHHVVATVEPSATSAANSVRLFVNGVEVGSPVSATGVLADWSGVDDAGLGAANGGFPDDANTTITGNFDGDIAGLRYYRNRLLNQGEVKANFDDLVNDSPYREGNYDTGSTVAGDSASPGAGIALTGGTDFTLSFNTLIDVEDAEEPFELMQVVVKDTTTMAEEVIMDRFNGDLPISTNGQWAQLEADLSPFAGQTVQIIFRFDSVDETGNAFEGWWIDDVQVVRNDAMPSTDDDQFSIDLTDSVGQRIDILLVGQSLANYSGQTLELRNADGSVLLATGVSDPVQPGANATNFDLGILEYEVVSAGIHTVRVVSDSATLDEMYSVVVTDSLSFESEPNGVGDPARSLDGTLQAVGYLQATATQQYTARAAFDADNPSLTVEDFETGVVDPEDTTTFAGPLNAATNNAAFPQGISGGLTIEASTPGGNLALVGADFFDTGNPGSKVVGADLFTDDTELQFPANTFAVGLDVFANGELSVTAFDGVGATIVTATVEAADTGAFWGLASDTAIDRIVIEEVGTSSGELIDNVAFGAAGVVPQPDVYLFEVSLNSWQSLEVITSTPFDDSANSLLNDLDPGLLITGPSTNLTDLNSAPDGKNAQITFTAPQTGTYTIQVSPESGRGEYVLQLSTEADFDQDGDVDGFDFLEWQRGFGTSYDANDLTNWETNYGQGSGLSGLSALSDQSDSSLLAAEAQESTTTGRHATQTDAVMNDALLVGRITGIQMESGIASKLEESVYVAEESYRKAVTTNPGSSQTNGPLKSTRRVSEIDAAIAELAVTPDQESSRWLEEWTWGLGD